MRFCYFHSAYIPIPDVYENTVYGNSAVLTGGGITIQDADFTIRRMTVDGNSAGVKGGGVYIHSWTADTLVNFVVSNSTGGGGIASDGNIVTDHCDV